MGRRIHRRDHDETPREHRLAPPDPRDKPLARLRDQVSDLLYGYAEGLDIGPGLLARLGRPDVETLLDGAGDPTASGGRSVNKPGSRPPMRLDLLTHYDNTLADALDLALLAGYTGPNPVDALNRLPVLYADRPLDEIRHAVRVLSRRISTARTALGYQQSAQDYPELACPHCQAHTIRGRPEQLRVWCANPECPGDPDTGEPYTFRSAASLRAVIPEARA